MRYLVAVFLLSCCGVAKAQEVSAPAPTASAPTATVAPTETLPAPDRVETNYDEILRRNKIRNAHPCPQWFDLATSVGWPENLWAQQSYIIHRESRCNIDSWNKTDPNSGSRGLMQINGFWCKPNRWTDHGWLQDHGVLNTCEDLFDPKINLRAALFMFYYSENHNGNGWRPWSMTRNFEPPIVSD